MADGSYPIGNSGMEQRMEDQGDGTYATAVVLTEPLPAGSADIGSVATPDTASAAHGEAVDIAAADHACASTTRALYVGGAGDVIATIGGVDLTFKAVPAGTVLPMQATVIKKVGTTATYMVALW